MTKTLTTTAVFLAGTVLAGSLLAQQTPTASTPAKTSTSTTKPATTAKKPATSTATAPLVLKTTKEKASYALGTSLGRQLHDDGVELDTAILARGMKDAMAGKEPMLKDEEMAQAVMDFQKEAHEALAAKNLSAGAAYRASFKAQEGVKETPDGLLYKVVTQGTGPKPTDADQVVCNYRGTFVDGKEFDSSYKRNEPLTIPVGGVIPGWTEALKMMPVGSKWQLVIPPALAYGAEGKRGMPPNSTLVFEVELLKIAEKPKDLPESPSSAPPAGAKAPSAPPPPGTAPATQEPPATPPPVPPAAPGNLPVPPKPQQ